MAHIPPFNFCGLPEELSAESSARIVVLPVPFDVSSSYVAGSDKGPEALIDASTHVELYDIETGTEVYRRGIFTAPAIRAATTAVMLEDTEAAVSRFIEAGKFVVTLGGEHTVSVAPIRAHAKAYPNLSVLQFDAHTDLREEYDGDPLSHACAMARAREVVEKIVPVGIRAIDSSELAAIDRSHTFFAHEIHGRTDWMDKAVSALTENVYITLDLDVFEIGLMPSTGTPEPGGMGWYDVTRLLRKVAETKNIVGFDVVELCPTVHTKAPDFLAAKITYTLLSYIFAHARHSA